MGDDSNIIKIGPVGYTSGSHWDEKGHDKIVQIFVSHEDGINSLQFQYVDNGTLVLSDRHGSSHGHKFDVVKLNYPAEYITWISCRQRYISCHICSITFGTNHGEYGPFGRFTSQDREFRFQLGEDRQFGGFFGTTDNSVKSIGVYLKPITSLDALKKNIVKVKSVV